MYVRLLVIFKYIQKLNNIDDKVFIEVIGNFIYENTNVYSYKEIIKILTYEIVYKEQQFDEIKFVPFKINIDEKKNFKVCFIYIIYIMLVQNVEIVRSALIEENKYYLEQINILKDLLDQMSDICGFEDFLKQSVLQDLDLYLDKYHEYISSHLQKYYLENKEDYMQSEYNNIGNINNASLDYDSLF